MFIYVCTDATQKIQTMLTVTSCLESAPTCTTYIMDSKEVIWMGIAIFLLIVAVLLAVTSTALGIIVYYSRKELISKSRTKLTTEQGTCM